MSSQHTRIAALAAAVVLLPVLGACAESADANDTFGDGVYVAGDDIPVGYYTSVNPDPNSTCRYGYAGGIFPDDHEEVLDAGFTAQARQVWTKIGAADAALGVTFVTSGCAPWTADPEFDPDQQSYVVDLAG